MLYTKAMEKHPNELTPIDLRNHQETPKPAIPGEETAMDYTIHLDSAIIPGTQQEVHKGQVILTAPQYSVNHFEKKGDALDLLLTNKDTNETLRIPVNEFKKIQKPEDLELFIIKGQLNEGTAQIERAFKLGRTNVMQQGLGKIEDNLGKLQNLSEKDPENAELQDMVQKTQSEITETQGILERFTPEKQQWLRELHLMREAAAKAKNMTTKRTEEEIAMVENMIKNPTETPAASVAVDVPEITPEEPAENIVAVSETIAPPETKKEKTPVEEIIEAREKYLKLYADSFREHSSLARGILNFGHAAGILKKDAKIFLNPEAKAAKDQYDALKNSFDQAKFDRLTAKGKSPEEAAAIMGRYRQFTKQLDFLEQESAILKSAREQAFHSKKLEAFKKNFEWYTNLKPKHKKAISLAFSIGVGSAIGVFTGGGSVAATVAARLARFAVGTGAGTATSKILEKVWKTGAGGKYETMLEDLKKKYLSGEMSPAEYQQRKEGYEQMENFSKTVKTGLVMTATAGAGIGTGNLIHNLDVPSVKPSSIIPETASPDSTATADSTNVFLEERDVAIEQSSVMPNTIEQHAFTAVSPDAVAKPGDSIWKIVERQIEHDPKLADALGVHDNPTTADMVKILRDFGYISDNGDVRISDFNNTAYELAIENGQPVMHEYSNGQFVETRTLTTGSEQGTVDTHEVFHEKETRSAIKQPDNATTENAENPDMIPDSSDADITLLDENNNVLPDDAVVSNDTMIPNTAETIETTANPETTLGSNEITTTQLVDKRVDTFVRMQFGSPNGFGSVETNPLWNQLRGTDAKAFLEQPLTSTSPSFQGAWTRMNELSVMLEMKPVGTVEEYLRALKLKELQLQQQSIGY